MIDQRQQAVQRSQGCQVQAGILTNGQKWQGIQRGPRSGKRRQGGSLQSGIRQAEVFQMEQGRERRKACGTVSIDEAGVEQVVQKHNAQFQLGQVVQVGQGGQVGDLITPQVQFIQPV